VDRLTTPLVGRGPPGSRYRTGAAFSPEVGACLRVAAAGLDMAKLFIYFLYFFFIEFHDAHSSLVESRLSRQCASAGFLLPPVYTPSV
jgi:hypothetical protein